MPTCVSCGADNPESASFCAECGEALAVPCGSCGASLPSNASFCPSCGARVAAEAEREELKLVTILFADVTGSTRLGERLNPEHLKEVLGTFFDAMRQEIEAEGGAVEKFIGDAVMAAFGVPSAHEDDASRALRAALRMQARLADLNETFTNSYGVALEMRVGVNTGEVVAVTEARPGEPMVTGDTVNLAARLEQAATPGRILVAERTVRAARGFRLREVGTLSLRGKTQAIRAFELVHEEPGEERGVPGLRAPMVGRDSEMSLLGTLYERAASERRPYLVTIYGDAGVGKSRLTAEFLDEAVTRDPSIRVVRGRCLPYGEGITFWPLAEILRSQAGILEDDPSDLVLEKVRELGRQLFTPEVVPEQARATAALAYTVGVEDPDVSFRDVAPRQVRAETHAAWRSFFSALALASPIIAVVEDLHWADPEMLDLLEELAERSVGPLLFMCTARPELTAGRPGWGGGRRRFSSVSLEPLGADDARRLVSLLLSVEGLPDDMRRRILDRAEGNPFFLEEIVRQLIDRDVIVRDQGRWRARADLSEIEIPDTVQAVLTARIDLLPAEEKRVLQYAAVVGKVFWPGPLETLLNGDAQHLTTTIDGLVDRELVTASLGSSLSGQPEFAFRHALTRDVAYETLPRRERAQAHARVANWIAQMVGDRRLEYVELLAYHYEEAHSGSRDDPRAEVEGTGELRTQALEHLLLASQVARSKRAVAKARRLAERALSLTADDLERSRALEALGDACNLDYRGDLAWKYFRQAVDARLLASPEDQRTISYLCARALESPTRWPGSMRRFADEAEAARYLEIGLSRAEDDSEQQARLLTARAFWPFGFRQQTPATEEELRQAVEDGERAAEMAEKLGRPDLASAALDAAASPFLMRGLYGRVAAIVDRRLEIARGLHDASEVGDIFAVAAWSRFHIGRYREALRQAEEGFKSAISGDPGVALHCLSWRAMANYRLADWDGLLDDVMGMEEILGDRRDSPPWFARRPLAAAALVHELRGDGAAADRLLHVTAFDDLPASRSSALLPWAARLLARRGAFKEARFMVEIEEPWLINRGLHLEAACDLLGEEGAWDDAPTVVADARAHADEAGLVALPLFADRLEGRAALATGDPKSALSLLTRASDGFEELGAAWEKAYTDLPLAEALLSEDPQRARGLLSGASGLFRSLSSVRDLARTEALLSRL